MNDKLHEFIRTYAIYIAIIGFFLAVAGIALDNDTLQKVSVLSSRTLLILVFLVLMQRGKESK